MSLIFACIFFILFQQQEAYGKKTVSSALYVFGDSVMDPGNNVFLNTPIKVNFSPFGIDFPGGPTGRFTNGYTIADFWYKWANTELENAIPLPYTSPFHNLGPKTGFNYASGTAGILPHTNRDIGENLWLGKQVELFSETIERYDRSRKVTQSVFVVCMGGNDYMNYLQPGSNISKSYNPEQFAEFLANQLGNHLQDLYNLGARKLVVFQIGPLGCLPAVIDKTKPLTLCNEQVNSLVSIFNKQLKIELDDLSSKLQGSTFVTAETYQLIHDIIRDPLQHGFEDARHPCCASGENRTGNCLPGTTPCKNRSSHVFWDSVHPTEAINRRIANECFYGKGICTPTNLARLFSKGEGSAKKTS